MSDRISYLDPEATINENELTVTQMRSIVNQYYNGFAMGWSNIAKICPYDNESAHGKAWTEGYRDGIEDQGSTDGFTKS